MKEYVLWDENNTLNHFYKFLIDCPGAMTKAEIGNVRRINLLLTHGKVGKWGHLQQLDLTKFLYWSFRCHSSACEDKKITEWKGEVSVPLHDTKPGVQVKTQQRVWKGECLHVNINPLNGICREHWHVSSLGLSVNVSQPEGSNKLQPIHNFQHRPPLKKKKIDCVCYLDHPPLIQAQRCI